jgi:hypothetical protein
MLGVAGLCDEKGQGSGNGGLKDRLQARLPATRSGLGKNPYTPMDPRVLLSE